jgi:hypothetical protein
MRLLDLIVQGRCPSVYAGDGVELPNPLRFVEPVRACPLRLVLTDELVRCATQLAFAEGDRLSACLDLIRVPAQSLWVEWADEPRRETLKAIPSLEVKNAGDSRHAGVLITASADGRTGHFRAFWSTPEDQAFLSPMVTVFSFDERPTGAEARRPVGWRGETYLTMEGEPAIEELLEHLRLHFDEEWAAYYQSRCDTEALQTAVLRSSLGGCAFDGPMLMALFLLLGARDMLPRQDVRHERINRIRRQGGKPPLLEHIQISAPLDRPPVLGYQRSGESNRFSPRLHHVRGHIVRRGSSVFWRSPHLRGSARLGQVRSRTVLLTYGATPIERATLVH